jgi:hypothetical protein
MSLGACTTLPGRPEPLPLQLQAFQTHEFEVDQTTAIRSVMSVFQDLGYIIQSADKDVGFITATSPRRDTTNFLNFLIALGGTASSSSAQTKATAVIEEVKPNLTTVRLNFVVNSRFVTNGSPSGNDKPIEDPEPYRVAFDKIEDAIFVRVAARSSPAAAGPTPADPNAPAAPAVAGATPANSPSPGNAPTPVMATAPGAATTPAAGTTPAATTPPGKSTSAPTINPADAVPRPPADPKQQHMLPSVPRPVRVIQTNR